MDIKYNNISQENISGPSDHEISTCGTQVASIPSRSEHEMMEEKRRLEKPA